MLPWTRRLSGGVVQRQLASSRRQAATSHLRARAAMGAQGGQAGAKKVRA